MAEPYLIRGGHLERCSVCGYPFPADVKPSISVTFDEHLIKAHKPGEKSEGANQAAFRVVREVTRKA